MEVLRFLEYYTQEYPNKEGFYFVYNKQEEQLTIQQFHKLSDNTIIGEEDSYEDCLFCYVQSPKE